MPKSRAKKENHLIYADAVGSRGKSGVWFGEREEYQAKQAEVMDIVRDRIDWVPLENAVMAVSVDPPGIAVIAPNPTLPGIIVLADGATSESSDALRTQFLAVVQEALETADVVAVV